MNRITSITARGTSNTGAAVLAYLQTTEYRFTRGEDGDKESMSVWRGKGAAALGLVGNVELEDMNKLARGYAPDGVTQLRSNAGKEPKWVPEVDDRGQPKLDDDGNPRGKWTGPRIGQEMTLSADKTVSLAYAMCVAQGDYTLGDAILNAHHAAVDAAIGSAEQVMETRRGKAGIESLGNVKLVVSRHTHFAGRETEDKHGDAAWDPQLHSHCLIYNVCEGPDGQWNTYDSGTLYDHSMALGALYRAELAAQLQKLGFQIEKTPVLDDEGQEKVLSMFKIAGFPDEMRQDFSKRTAAMAQWMKDNDSSDARLAAVATRLRKDEPTYAELVKLWGQALGRSQAEHPDWPKNVGDVLKAKAPELQAIDDDALLERLHKNTAVFERKELLLHIAQEYVGLRDAKGAEQEADAFVKRMVEQKKLVLIEPHRRPDDAAETMNPGRKHTDVRFAAQFVIDLEQQLLDRTRERKDEPGARISSEAAEKSIQKTEARKTTHGHPFKMADEQKKAVHYLCAESGGVATMTGYAGAGKTNTLSAAADAWKAEGRECIGTSSSWKAALNLQAETGVKSVSIARLRRDLDSGKTRLTDKSVLIIDEAGMVGTRDLHALSEKCAEAKAKLVLVGDPRQLQPVTWGAPMRLLEQEGHTKLTEIRRQQTQEGRDIANLFYELPSGKPGARSREQSLSQSAKIWKRLEKGGMIHGFDDKTKAMKQMANDWFKSGVDERERLAICSSNADVAAMNHVMRDHAKATGRLAHQDYLMARMTAHGQRRELPLAQGERIAFTKKMALRTADGKEGLDAVNGDQAIITHIRSGQHGIGLDITARMESDVPGKDGKEVTWNTELHGRGTSIRHSWAMTVHKSQSLGKKHVMLLAHAGMTDEATALVGFTRTKNEFALYGDHDGLDLVKERQANERLAMNALEEGVRQPKGKTKSPKDQKVKRSPPETFLDRLNARMGFMSLPDRATPAPPVVQVAEPPKPSLRDRLKATFAAMGVAPAPAPKPAPMPTKPEAPKPPVKEVKAPAVEPPVKRRDRGGYSR